MVVTKSVHSTAKEDNPMKCNASETKCRAPVTKICPLCQAEVRWVLINYNVKLLMCENTECDYPFGHEELQFCKVNEQYCHDKEDHIQSTDEKSPITSSIVSNSTCQEMSSTNSTQYLEEVQQEDTKPFNSEVFINSKVTNEEQTEEIKIENKLKEMRAIETKYLNLSGYKKRNKKFLSGLQESYAHIQKRYLMPEEAKPAEKKRPCFGEVKVEIKETDSNMIAIDLTIAGSNDPV